MHIRSAFYLLLMSLAFSFTAGKKLLAQTLAAKFQNVIDTTFKAHRSATGIMIGIANADEKLWTYAIGFSDKVRQTELNADQPILIASNTKTYISAAIFRLYELGKLDISDTIGKYLTRRTLQALEARGYETDEITISNLLSHTSGVDDYVNDEYFDFVNEHKQYRWTRNEQITRAMTVGKRLASPGDTFKYADVNYLLLTEIIEQITKKPFYNAISELDNFKDLRLNETWFMSLEPFPKHTPELAHQYWSKYSWDSYDLDPSWDLFGGGGMTATTSDLALFFKYLFEGKIIKDTNVLSKMYTSPPCKSKTNYCMGLRNLSIAGMKGYYHGGFWGTDAIYFPELKTAICIVVLEKNERDISADICKAIAEIIKQERTK